MPKMRTSTSSSTAQLVPPLLAPLCPFRLGLLTSYIIKPQPLVLCSEEEEDPAVSPRTGSMTFAICI